MTPSDKNGTAVDTSEHFAPGAARKFSLATRHNAKVIRYVGDLIESEQGSPIARAYLGDALSALGAAQTMLARASESNRGVTMTLPERSASGIADLYSPYVVDFVEESNRIEGITRPPTDHEIRVTDNFIRLRRVEMSDLAALVSMLADAEPRFQPGMDVRVGSHTPPRGGPEVEHQLAELLEWMHDGRLTPYEAHRAYETLHPFMDGNGRSGRALWAWHMLRSRTNPFGGLSFLHRWYYQSLEASRA